MESLRNLQDLYNSATERIKDYKGEDFVLPQIFKEQVTTIGSSTISYNQYSAILSSPGGLNIFMPNQWFYIASFFTDLYNELLKYKKEAMRVLTKERIKVLDGSTFRDGEIAAIHSLGLDVQSEDLLMKFLTDYRWWNGAKTIDRGDFYVSPILSCASLVNASQSFVAELCAFLADKKDLVKSIIEACENNDTKGGNQKKDINENLQQIFYGAPGTGKSHKINEETKKQPQGNVFRTTFHPDSDYSTFVGCYKPTMQNKEPIYKIGELINKLTEIKSTGVTYPCHKFAAKYWESLKDLSSDDIKNILLSCKFTESMNVEISKGVAIGQDLSDAANSKKIAYSFIPQAFTKAYLRAWQTTEPVYLVIEEINRGNCAQIFGDLFQLLDRKNGVSEYSIKPDTDLGTFIADNMTDPVENAPEAIIKGEEMKLPSNLYIWATMNTSDQSLFPIDSAFKRRWDWVYVPINENKEQWSIEVEGVKYSWSSFLKIVNKRIFKATSSEDKQLGFYFCKAEDNTITAETFVSKVLFYLWNDVFKDYDEGESIFKASADEPLTFSMFYNTDGSVNKQKVKELLDGLEIEKTGDDNDLTGDTNEEDDDGNSTSSSTKDYSKYSVNGEGSYGKNRLASECVRKYVELNPEKTADEVYNIWISLGNIVPHFIETKEQYDSRTDSSKRSYEITIGNSSVFVAHNGYGSNGMVNVLIEKVNAKDWGIKIEKLNS